jgi:hypothetical protein
VEPCLFYSSFIIHHLCFPKPNRRAVYHARPLEDYNYLNPAKATNIRRSMFLGSAVAEVWGVWCLGGVQDAKLFAFACQDSRASDHQQGGAQDGAGGLHQRL